MAAGSIGGSSGPRSHEGAYISAPLAPRRLPEWLFRPIVPSFVAAVVTILAGMGALHAYTFSLWSEQEQALRLLTGAVLAAIGDEPGVDPHQVVVALGVETRSDVLPVDTGASCAIGVQAAIDAALGTLLAADLTGLGEALCASRHPMVRPFARSPGFLVATPVSTDAGPISSVRLLLTTGRPPPSLGDLAHRPAGLAIVAAVAGVATILAYQWSKATRQRLERLLHEASFDGLTRSLRREAFLDELAAAVAETRSSGRRLSVMVVDVDRLKPTNDRFGHRVGDEVLRSVADLIRNDLRSGDIVGRLGGDEFAAMMRGADAEQSAAVAERIRAHVEAECAEVGGAPVAVTVSIGVAELREDDDAKSLLERGDLNLYTAKRSNRNRVVIVG